MDPNLKAKHSLVKTSNKSCGSLHRAKYGLHAKFHFSVRLKAIAGAIGSCEDTDIEALGFPVRGLVMQAVQIITQELGRSSIADASARNHGG